MIEGNVFVAVAILVWPMVAVFLFRLLPLNQAALWTILGGLLLLPNGIGIKLQMIPGLDKNSVPNLCALIGCLTLAPRAKGALREFGLTEILVIIFIFGPLITSIYNTDAIVVGDTVLPGVGIYDGISAVLGQALLFLSFIVGRRFLRNASDTEEIMRVLAIAGLLYSLPMLFEIRMSPQLANWIYGYSTPFAIEVRYGGYRPVVFMQNGLAAAFFMATAFLAALANWRARMTVSKLPSGAITFYLGAVIVLCKSAGALVYTVVVGVCVRWMSPKVQVRLAVILVSIGLAYPVLRFVDLFPTNALVETAAVFSQERADSLKFRFDQEQELLAHASERMLVGWGRYGRNRVYSEESGKDDSITDGLWIITLGQFGMAGFLAQFGLLALPIFRALGAFKFIRQTRERVIFAALCLIIGLSVVEQLPNASVSSWTWLLAGSLLGRTETLRASIRKRQLNDRMGEAVSLHSSSIISPPP